MSRTKDKGPLKDRKVWTSSQVGELLAVHASTVMKWGIEHYKTLGGHRRYRRETVLDFCRKNPEIGRDFLLSIGEPIPVEAVPVFESELDQLLEIERAVSNGTYEPVTILEIEEGVVDA